MVNDAQHCDDLFLFNDNFEHRNATHVGRGSACLRPFARFMVPRSAGIATGWSTHAGGFEKLAECKEVIKLGFERVLTILEQHVHLKRVIFSCDPTDPSQRRIGCDTFAPCDEVMVYISKLLWQLPARFADPNRRRYSLMELLSKEASIERNLRRTQQLQRQPSCDWTTVFAVLRRAISEGHSSLLVSRFQDKVLSALYKHMDVVGFAQIQDIFVEHVQREADSVPKQTAFEEFCTFCVMLCFIFDWLDNAHGNFLIRLTDAHVSRLRVSLSVPLPTTTTGTT